MLARRLARVTEEATTREREHQEHLTQLEKTITEAVRARAEAEQGRDRAAAELAAHLALPWWRRLFA